MAGQNQIVGGAFQDFEGSVLANGYLTMQLSHDAQESVGPGQVVAGYPRHVPLDANGNIAGTVLVWPNDQLDPANTFYIINAFRHDGVLAWGPQFQTVSSSPSPFNVGVWVPNNPPSGGAPVGSILLQNNGINNQSQSKLNLESTDSSVTITDLGSGAINLQGKSTSFSTPGQGWFLGGKDFGSVLPNAGASPTPNGTANQVGCVQVILESAWVISHLQAFVITGAGSGNFMTCALYSANGNTKLIDAGASFVDLSTHSQWTYNVVLSAPVTLQPGVYWFAWGGAQAGSVLIHTTNIYLNDLINGLNFTDAQVGATRAAVAANGLSAGAMPATLGTLTPVDASYTNFNIPAVMFIV
jgi:hypothetical protein